MRSFAAADAWPLFKRAIKGWVDDQASGMSAALAFYSLFSLAPLLIIAIALAGFFIGRGEAHDAVVTVLGQLMGPEPAQAVANVVTAATKRTNGLIPAIFGFVAIVAGSTTVFTELRRDLNVIWRCRVEKTRGIRDFVLERALACAVVVSIGVLLLLSLAASAAISALSDLFGGSHAIARGAEVVASLVVITALFAAIYKLLPSRPIAWGDVWVGAAFTSLLFWVGKYLIGLYLGKAAVGSAYGAAGTLVVVIMWIYYSTLIFLLGAEFTREYALRRGSRQGDLELGMPATDLGAANEGMVERARKIVKRQDPVLLRRK